MTYTHPVSVHLDTSICSALYTAGTYSVSMRAVDSSGNISEATQEQYITLPGVPRTLIDESLVLYKEAAQDITVGSGGNLRAEERGADVIGIIVENGGTMTVYNHATAKGTIIRSGGRVESLKADLLEDTVIDDGGILYFQNYTSKNTTVNAGGIFYCEGDSALDTTVNRGGILAFTGNGSLTGRNIFGGTIVARNTNIVPDPDSNYMGYIGNAVIKVEGEIVFAVNQRQSGDNLIIDDLSAFRGASYSITVSANQASGNYLLAGNAAAFNQKVTIMNTEYSTLGYVTVGSTLAHGDHNYKLTINNGNLSLLVTNQVSSNLLSSGYSQIVAWDAARGKVGYVATNGQAAPPWRGIWEWSGSEASMWKVVGVGRFSNSVEHDGILLYNGYGNTFAAWTDLGRGDYGYVSLCHVEGNFQTKTLADFDGNGLDDVIIYDEKGSFGIVSDARTYHDVWHVDNAATNVQKLIGAGYFGNADGMSEILVKKTDENAYFLWHNEDPTFNTWNWTQTYIGTLGNDWEVAAIGDFQGDGIDDIIMWQKSTGYIYAWENGKSSNQRWVGQLDSNKWEIAAVGDYNGDGKEDLLLRELSSGWGGVGYWGSANASNWTDLNARIETDMESKFAVIA